MLFRDEEKWLIGLYIPEFESKNEIGRLEKHDASEFFHLLEGNIVHTVLPDVPLENYLTFIEVAKKYGKYPINS